MYFANNTTNITLPLNSKTTEGVPAATIALASFLVLVTLLAIFGNSLVCFSVFSYHRLRSPTNFLIVSLAVSDFLVGTLSLPFRLAQLLNYGKWPVSLGREGCQFWIWMDMLCCGASIVNLAGISVDRLLAIKRPLRYREEMTSKRAFLIILFVWIYAFTGASLSFVQWEGQDTITYIPECGIKAKIYITIMAFAGFFCPLSIVVVCYGIVLHIAIRHALVLQKEKDSIAVNFPLEPNGNKQNRETIAESQYLSLKQGANDDDSDQALNSSHAQPRRSKTTASTFNIMKQIKATKTLAIVVGVFILCWFPFFVIFLTFQYCGNVCFDGRLSTETKQALLMVFVYVLPVSNSAANPIIYSCFNQEFRMAFLKIFYRLVGKTYRPKFDGGYQTYYTSSTT